MYCGKSQRSSAVLGAPGKGIAGAATDPKRRCHLVPHPSLTSKHVTQPRGPVSSPCGPCSRALPCSELAGGLMHGALDPGEKTPSHLQWALGTGATVQSCD